MRADLFLKLSPRCASRPLEMSARFALRKDGTKPRKIGKIFLKAHSPKYGCKVGIGTPSSAFKGSACQFSQMRAQSWPLHRRCRDQTYAKAHRFKGNVFSRDAHPQFDRARTGNCAAH